MWASARKAIQVQLYVQLVPWEGLLNLPSKLPPLRHPVKGRMALERAHVGREQAEADGAAAVAVVDAVDQRRQFLAPAVVGVEQIRLVVIGRHQVKQHDADAERLGARHP